MSELAAIGDDPTLARLEIAARFARLVAGTDFIPESYRKKDAQGQPDYERTNATVAAAVYAGKELGFEPMAAMRAIVIIRGVPALTALGLRALVQSAGHSLVVMESTNTRAVVRGRRLGTAEPEDVVWTIDDARRMIQSFSDPKGPWQRMPRQMLVARATAEAARRIASDVILGMPYVVDEIGDEIADVEAQPPAPPQRQRTASRKTPSPALPRGGPLPPPPAHPRGGAGGDEAAGSDHQGAQEPSEASGEPAPVSTPDPAATPITEPQRRRIMAGLRDIGVTDADVARGLISDWIGRTIRSRNELTSYEASVVIERLDQQKIDNPGEEAE